MSASVCLLLPVCYLPPIDYYCHIVRNPNILFEKFETYPKQTYRNRAIILSANGPLRLSVPVIKPYGNKSMTSEILIDNKTAWSKIHLRAINSAYNKSPFFLYYKDELEALLAKPDELLIDFNISLFNTINKFLKFRPATAFTTEYLKSAPECIDYRDYGKKISPSHYQLKPYNQVFSDRNGFIPDLSIIDLIFNEGPHALQYLKDCLPID